MIKVRTFGNIVIFDIVGSTSDTELTQQNNLEPLLREIEECYRSNHRQIIINLEKVLRIDHDTVVKLLMKQSSREGLSIRFYGMQSRVEHALKSAGLFSALQVYQSQRDAVQSFS